MAKPKVTAEEKEFERNRLMLRAIGLLAFFVLSFGSVFYHFVEHLKWLDSFYFSTITLTTVGYGDITPHTDAGKIFTVFYVLIGIGIIGTFANFLIRNAGLRRQAKNSKKK